MAITDHITGTVIHGLGNGRKLGFPTANVAPDTPPALEKGVYAVWVRVNGKRFLGMLYVGTRPTLDLETITYEIHIFGLRRNLYNEKIAFSVIRKIRDEKRFKSVKELTKALQNDKNAIKELLRAPRHAMLTKAQIPAVLEIIEQAKRRMKAKNLDQWQTGYPNEETLMADHAHQQGHVFLKNGKVVAYAAIVFDPDPFYKKIDGKWLSSGKTYVTVHRIAVHDDWLRHGFAEHILQYAERMAARKGVRWFRIDTHHDNRAMRNLVREAGFTFCGVVQVRDGKRMAYEKFIGETQPK